MSPQNPQSSKTKIPPLPDATLAQCIQRLREERSWTRNELSEKSAVPLSTIHDLEEGILVFLPVTHRQRLARALRVFPIQLEALEKDIPSATLTDTSNGNRIKGDLTAPMQKTRTSSSNGSSSTSGWRFNAYEPVPPCPECRGSLRVKQFHREDMHGHPLHVFQITCSQCLFRHWQEQAS